MIKIGEKAVQVLNYISKINGALIINKEALYTKYVDSIESKASGEPNIVVKYVLPENEIDLEQDFGIFNINEFLKVTASFDKETLEMEQEGNTIVIKDKRKETQYYTNGLDSWPIEPQGGDELFQSGVSTIVFALSEADITEIQKDLNMLNFDKLILKLCRL